MAIDVVEQKVEEAESIARTEVASRSLPGDLCSSLHAPFALRPMVDNDPVETKEWLDAFRGVLETEGFDRARFLIEQLRDLALAGGAANFCPRNTPYINTIPVRLQPPRPGDADLERSITSLIRWNALCMVSQANEKEHGIGGHIATFASAATLYEAAFHHFFKGPNHPDGPDLVYFQGQLGNLYLRRVIIDTVFATGHPCLALQDWCSLIVLGRRLLSSVFGEASFGVAPLPRFEEDGSWACRKQNSRMLLGSSMGRVVSLLMSIMHARDSRILIICESASATAMSNACAGCAPVSTDTSASIAVLPGVTRVGLGQWYAIRPSLSLRR